MSVCYAPENVSELSFRVKRENSRLTRISAEFLATVIDVFSIAIKMRTWPDEISDFQAFYSERTFNSRKEQWQIQTETILCRTKMLNDILITFEKENASS